jgi:hypothetical protein
MVRKARFNLPAIPQHLIQRGNNRAPIPPHRINASRYYLGREKRGRESLSEDVGKLRPHAWP